MHHDFHTRYGWSQSDILPTTNQLTRMRSAPRKLLFRLSPFFLLGSCDLHDWFHSSQLAIMGIACSTIWPSSDSEPPAMNWNVCVILSSQGFEFNASFFSVSCNQYSGLVMCQSKYWMMSRSDLGALGMDWLVICQLVYWMMSGSDVGVCLETVQLQSMAAILKLILQKMDVAFAQPPFNYVIQTAPLDPANWDLPYYHWYLRLVPHLVTLGGFELGSGCYINPVGPEKAAEFLRNIKLS